MIPLETYTVPPVPGHGLTKKEAGYVEHGPFGCRNCLWFQKPTTGTTGTCKPVGGVVDAGGCCDYFNDKDAPQDQGKAGVEYVFVPAATYTCSECRYYRDQRCWPVFGEISPGASCNKWMP